MDGTEQPIYLHFLDRELAQSVNFRLTHKKMESILKSLVAGTSAPLYCGISLVWENTALSEASRAILASLTEARTLLPVSYNSSIEEFIESRVRLYRHDADRYPLYFSGGIDELRKIRASLFKPSDTTDQLEQYLGGWAAGASKVVGESDRVARVKTLQALASRDSEAITYSFFSPFLRATEESPSTERAVRLTISTGYSNHYLDYAGGDIATGIDALSYYDAHLARQFPLHDVVILRQLLRLAGFSDLVIRPWSQCGDAWNAILLTRGEGSHRRTTQLFRVVLHAATRFLETSHRGGESQFGVRSWIRSLLARFEDTTAQLTDGSMHLDISERWALAADALSVVVARMSRIPELAAVVEASRMTILDDRADVLIVTATTVETRAVLDEVPNSKGEAILRRYIGDKTFWDLGFVGGARTYLVQTEMGSGGPSGSILTITESIAALNPAAVIVAGIAFGVDPIGQKIGDILISRQVLSYELQRVEGEAGTTRIVLRGDRASASPRLLDRCRAAAVSWRGRTLRFGLVLSGDKLIDNVKYRDELVRLAGGEVVGGEMEGAGVYSSAHRRKVDWILIKSICDWADGNKGVNKKERQHRAAVSAAQFVSHLLGEGGLIRS